MLSHKCFSVKLCRSVTLGPDAEIDDRTVDTQETTKETVCAEGKLWPIDYTQGGIGGESDPVINAEGELFSPTKLNGSFTFPDLSVRVGSSAFGIRIPVSDILNIVLC